MRMRMLLKLWVVPVVLAASLGSASAQPLEASLSLVSDPGDYIGAGQSYVYALDTATITTRSGQDGGYFNMTVFSFGGEWWYVDLAAPVGSQLVPGTYEGAVRWPFQSPGQPGVSVTGNGRGCNTVTGRFEVLEAVFGPNGYLERFHARFEQHCEGGEPAIRGELFVVNPPPPPPLEVTLSINGTGRVDRFTGRATLTGTITCTTDVVVNLTGTLSQRATRFALATGYGWTPVPCSPSPTPWTLAFQPQGSVPFGNGVSQLNASGSAYDSYYGNQVTVSANTVIRLTPK